MEPSQSVDSATDHGWFKALRLAFTSTETEEKVRGFLAVFFIGVLLALLFFKPSAGDTSAAVTSAKTLAIAVVAFYFGLHGATPHAKSETETKNDTTR